MYKQKLNITILDFDDIRNPLLGAGQSKVTYEVGSRFVKEGHSVVVISSKYPGCKNRIDNGITYKHIGICTQNIRINNLIYISCIPFAVVKIKSDIILECFTAPISTLLSPLFTKIPVVGLSTSFDAKRFSRQYKFPFWLVEKYGARSYKYFIALTPFLANKMKKLNKKVVVRTIPQGVSREYFAVNKAKSLFILFIGRLDLNQKGLDLLVKAYARVEKQIKYPLVIAGQGPDGVKLEKLISKYKLAEKVSLIGYADEKKKIELLSNAAFLAFPSRDEGFSLVSLEALASGNRLVAFKIPSLNWANKEIVRKVNPFSIDDYSKALLLESRRESSFTNFQCRSVAKNYSWDNVANQFMNFFQEIVGDKHI